MCIDQMIHWNNNIKIPSNFYSSPQSFIFVYIGTQVIVVLEVLLVKSMEINACFSTVWALSTFLMPQLQDWRTTLLVLL